MATGKARSATGTTTSRSRSEGGEAALFWPRGFTRSSSLAMTTMGCFVVVLVLLSPAESPAARGWCNHHTPLSSRTPAELLGGQTDGFAAVLLVEMKAVGVVLVLMLRLVLALLGVEVLGVAVLGVVVLGEVVLGVEALGAEVVMGAGRKVWQLQGDRMPGGSSGSMPGVQLIRQLAQPSNFS
mmetsp:Transcript_122113/g.260588  ORF Transcript_122113/g.260588 Transcript_122113/m.260588 type:complete len:183 (-) Transcript_122113:117-665(-)